MKINNENDDELDDNENDDETNDDENNDENAWQRFWKNLHFKKDNKNIFFNLLRGLNVSKNSNPP